MKVYNEIVFDVDGKVVYEDSYEYSGDVIYFAITTDTNPVPNTTTVNADIENTFDDVSEYWTDIIQDAQDAAMAAQTQASDIQLNAMPSLPSISNVGSIAPTGAVNWSAIPGGFQPLPQTAGGTKKLYQLSQFHGGINQKSSPRDISDVECQEAINVTVSEVGRIKLLGDCLNTNTIGADISADSIDENFPGYGLFQFVAPADHDAGNVGETVFTCVANGDEVDVYTLPDGTTASWITGLGTTDNTTVCQVYYASGNGLYVADANFDHENVGKAKVYVSRNDINATVSVGGWVQGNPLITSPTRAASNAANSVSIETAAVNASADGEMAIQIEDTDTGSWDGTYFFYVSWLFDGGCETGLTSLGSDDGFEENVLEFNVSIKHTNAAPLGGDKRIEGARVYFKESGTAERFLLAEISLQDGVRGALDSTFIPWDNPSGTIYDLASDIVFDSPPSVHSYASQQTASGFPLGYTATEVYTKSSDAASDGAGPTPIPVRYKTAVAGQRGIIFIGNVIFDGKHMPDSMMFSMPGKPGLFPKYNRFDSTSSDGSPITVLAAFQDTILQFKQNALYVVNVADISQPFIQASFRDCGVFNPCQVFTTSFGVIFANKFGCFIYTGKGVISLTNGKFDWLNQSGVSEATSNASDASVPCVGYDPRSKSIIVLKNIGDDSTNTGAWVYNMTTQSWTESDAMITNADARRHTNFITTNDGYLAIKRDNDGTLLNYNHDKSVDTGAQTITYQTKDLDFGLPSQTKKLFKVYITYKGTPPSTINYRTDGSSTPLGFTETNWAAAGVDDYEVATLVPDDTDEGKGWKSMSIYMNGSATSTFEISDISILYRVRPIK